MTAVAIIGLIASILGIVAFMWGVLRWAHKRGWYLIGWLMAKHAAPVAAEAMRAILTEELAPLVKQLSPNSGTSAVDRLARIDQWREDFTESVNSQFTAVSTHLQEQDRALLRHLENHAKT